MKRETSTTENTFKDELRRRIADKLGENYRVSVSTVYKVNLTLDGLTIQDLKSDSNISPNIYLNQYYLDYLRHDLDMDEIADKIIQVYERYKIDVPFDLSCFTDWNIVKNCIVAKVINKERNHALLENVPHGDILNELAIVYYAVIDMNSDGTSSILVKNEHVEMWGVSLEEINEVAYENSRRLLPATVTSIEDTLREILIEDLHRNMLFEDEETIEEMLNQMQAVTGHQMYVVTNSRKSFGAHYGFDKKMLKEFCDNHDVDSCIIIPSSLHECLWVLVEDQDFAMFNQICREVNDTQVAEEDILGSNCFLYTVETDSLSLI